MIFIFDLAIFLFLLFMGYRLSLTIKERHKLKEELKLDSKSSERLNFLNIFLFFMFILLGIVIFTYANFVIGHFKMLVG